MRLGALRTALIASDLSRLDRSVLAILGWGRFQPALVVEVFLQVPYRASGGSGVNIGDHCLRYIEVQHHDSVSFRFTRVRNTDQMR